MDDDEDVEAPQKTIDTDRPEFPWEIEEAESEDRTTVKRASTIFPWEAEDDEQKTDSTEDLFDFAKWKIDK